MSGSLNFREFVSGFLVEAEDHLRSARTSLVRLEQADRAGLAEPRSVRDLYRALHTMKGIAGMVGIEPIVELAHAMESVLRPVDRGESRLDRDALELLMQGTEAIAERVRALGNGEPAAAAPKGLLDALTAIEARVGGGAQRPAFQLDTRHADRLTPGDRELLLAGLTRGAKAFELEFRPSPSRASAGVTITSFRERVGSVAEIVKVIPVSVPDTEPLPGLVFVLVVLVDGDPQRLHDAVGSMVDSVTPLIVTLPEPPSPSRGDTAPPVGSSDATEKVLDETRSEGLVGARVVRVDVGRVDETMDRLAAVLMTRERLVRAVDELADHGADVRALRVLLADAARELRGLRAAVVGLRLVPLETVLAPLPLLVRGLQISTGKPVDLDLPSGAGVSTIELDKTVGDRLWPALVHLVRNAVDHGLESPSQRASQRKPATGRITVGAAQRGNSRIEITVEDDGGGVDGAAVARRAGRPAPTSDAALLEILAMPGLSTRDEANATSGRGLGLDIVRRIVVDDLGGELEMETKVGRGTRFVLRVPITVAVVDTFRVEAGSCCYLVPVTMVDEFVEVQPRDLTVAPSPRGSTMGLALLQRRGATLPFVHLDAALSRAHRTERPEDAVRKVNKAIVVRRGARPFAFGVDRLLGRHEVVVRPLLDPLVQVPGISGSTDLGTGEPTLVLDIVALSQRCESELLGRAA